MTDKSTIAHVAAKCEIEGLGYAILEGYAKPVSDHDEWNELLAVVESALRRMQAIVEEEADMV